MEEKKMEIKRSEFDRSGNFGCVNYNCKRETCIDCGICTRPDICKEDCDFDEEENAWFLKPEFQTLYPAE